MSESDVKVSDESGGGRWTAAIVALLATPTIKVAAESSNVPYATLRRWMGKPAFRRRLATARAATIEHAGTLLAEANARAAKKLTELLNCGNPAIELGAANSIIDRSFKFRELLDIQDELERVFLEMKSLAGLENKNRVNHES